MEASRGTAMSAYVPPFNPATSAKIYGNNIQSGVITSAHIADGTVIAADIKDGAVTSAKLGVSAVHNENISGGAVTEGALAVNAVTSAKMKAAFLSGTLVSGKVTFSAAHGLSAIPKLVVVVPLHTAAQAISATSVNLSLAAASAATSALFFIIGNQPAGVAMKFVAYVQL